MAVYEIYALQGRTEYLGGFWAYQPAYAQGYGGYHRRKQSLGKRLRTNSISMAYLYGREENYIQATEYILERPARANDLKNTVSELVESYINTDAKDEQLSRMLDELIDKCAGDLEYWAYN